MGRRSSLLKFFVGNSSNFMADEFNYILCIKVSFQRSCVE